MLALCDPLCFVLIGLALSLAEPHLLAGDLGRWTHVHRVFALTFALAAGLTAAVCGAVAARAHGRPARRPALLGGLSAAVGFGLTDGVMLALGWRVGHFDFPDRLTMLTVGGLGLTVAAALGGAVILHLLRGEAGFLSGVRLPGRRQHRIAQGDAAGLRRL